jgi:hypothetical protein
VIARRSRPGTANRPTPCIPVRRASVGPVSLPDQAADNLVPMRILTIAGSLLRRVLRGRDKLANPSGVQLAGVGGSATSSALSGRRVVGLSPFALLR